MERVSSQGNGGDSSPNRQRSVSLQAGEFLRLGPNRYEILQALSGRGRWLVRDKRPPPMGTKLVAVLLPESTELQQFRHSLRRVPTHASSLPRLIDQGRYGDQYCLVLDWVQGIDLREYLKQVRAGRTDRPSVSQCIRLTRGLAHGLRVLHDVCRVVHGDVKPGNLVLTARPSLLRAIDFGSSWQIERTRDRVSGDGSDPVFTAPEFFTDGTPVSAASDQFSLGVVLYQLLTLGVPFEGFGGKAGLPEYRAEFPDGPESIRAKVASPEKIPVQILDEIDSLLRTMLEWDPKDRFPNSRAWTNAFDAVCQQIESAAHFPALVDSPLDRAVNWIVRWGERLGLISSARDNRNH
jgi:eukaryotic-like serine/threonine-protein kinase